MPLSSPKIKKVYRFVLDLLVIVVAALVLWPYVYFLLPYSYFDETIPDEIRTLDAEIDTFMQTARYDFATLYNNPNPEVQHERFVRKPNSQPLSDQTNYGQSIKSVVYITTYDGTWLYNGSGNILTADGVILTNYHVIADSEQIVVTTTGGETYEVTDVLAYDNKLDIAFIKINAEGLTPLPIGDSSKVRVGDKTLLIGHPEGYINTLSLGNISGIRDYSSQNAGIQFQFTNPMSMGNSGGAVLNEYGELIAVPSWGIEYENNIVQVQNINFAIPINEAMALLGE